MASIRKEYLRPKQDGSRQIRWIVDWADAAGKRRKKAFKTKRAAEDYRAKRVLDPDIGNGATVQQAAESFLRSVEALVHAGERRRSTYEQKRQHFEGHLYKHPIALQDVATVEAADLQEFYDWLLDTGRSVATARKIAATVHQLWGWAARRRYKANHSAAIIARIEAPRSQRSAEPVEIPAKSECRGMLEAADARREIDRGRAAAVFRILMLSGLRAGEMRALAWSDLSLASNSPEVRIRRTVDKFNQIHNSPKTDAGRRDVPLSPDTVAALKAWKLACPPSDIDLVFPNERGGIWRHDHLYRNLWTPVMKAAGLASPTGKGPLRKHPKGNYRPTIWTPDYSPHRARHVAASIWIANGAQRGWIKKKMGHSTTKLVDDLYGHLWPDLEEDARLAAAADRAFE